MTSPRHMTSRHAVFWQKHWQRGHDPGGASTMAFQKCNFFRIKVLNWPTNLLCTLNIHPKLHQNPTLFEHTCAYARWALRCHCLSVRLWLDQNSWLRELLETGPEFRLAKGFISFLPIAITVVGRCAPFNVKLHFLITPYRKVSLQAQK